MVSAAELCELIREIETEDPIDFADLPFDDQALRQQVASDLCNMSGQMQSLSAEDREITLMAVAARLVLENLVLNIQLLRQHHLATDAEIQALLKNIGKT